VPTAAGLPRMVGAAATRAAGDDTTDRAQLHARIVDGRGGAVYSLVVLRLRDDGIRLVSEWRAARAPGRGHPSRAWPQ
jgi:hypothetical protein